MVQHTYPVEPQLGQEGLLWVEIRVFYQPQPGVNFHSLPEGECLNIKPLKTVEKLSNVYSQLENCRSIKW